jgi:hypothetical protein
VPLCLHHALVTGELLADIRRCQAPNHVQTSIATYKAIGRCHCGWPILIHVVVRQGQESAGLDAAILAESCPGCSRALSPVSVSYAGIYSTGRPMIPATAIGHQDLAAALAILEAEKQR